MKYNKKDNQINLSKEKREKLIKDIQAFFLDQRDEEIGDLQAGMLVDLLIEKVGAEVYNSALYGAKAWFEKRLDDIQSDFYNLEKR